DDRAEADRHTTNPPSHRLHEHLRAELEHYVQHNTASRWVEELREAGIPCSEVFTIAQGVEFASEIGLDPVQSTGDEQIATIKHPVEYSRSQVTYDKAPPKLNEDAQEILDWLNTYTASHPGRAS